MGGRVLHSPDWDICCIAPQCPRSRKQTLTLCKKNPRDCSTTKFSFSMCIIIHISPSLQCLIHLDFKFHKWSSFIMINFQLGRKHIQKSFKYRYTFICVYVMILLKQNGKKLTNFVEGEGHTNIFKV